MSRLITRNPIRFTRPDFPDMRGLVAMYDARYGVTSSGGKVSNWADLTGLGGRDLAQATGANQPTITADTDGELGIVTDGIAQYMETPDFGLTQPTEIYLVGKQISWTAVQRYVDGLTVDSMAIQASAGVSPEIVIRASTVIGVNSNLAVGTRGVILGVFNGASSLLQVNKTAAVTGNAGALDGGGITIGRPGATSGNYGNFMFNRLFVYDKASSSAERAYRMDSIMRASMVS